MMSLLRKRWKFLLGVLISVFFLWFSLRGLHLSEVWAYIRQANYGWIIPGVIVYFGAVWARTWRWHYLLRPLKAVSLAAAVSGGLHRLLRQQRLPCPRRRGDPRVRAAAQ